MGEAGYVDEEEDGEARAPQALESHWVLACRTAYSAAISGK